MTKPVDELVDIIDEHGYTIATVPRREMRGKRLPHRCVYVLVFNPRHELLIHLRTPTKDVFPSHWDVAIGGVLAAGEDFDSGAQRETYEEIGIDAPLETLFPFRYEDARTVVQAKVFRLVHEGPFHLQPEEVVCAEFVSLSELDKRIRQHPFCPDGVEVLRTYRERFNLP
jgi:isopentenyldiphosphate isomerase